MKTLMGLVLAMAAFPALAAITFYGGTVKTGTGPDTLNLKPSSSGASGDLLIAQIIAKSDATITAPAGWTKITAASTTASGLQQQIYYNTTWDGDTNGTETFTIAGTGASNASNGVIINVRGASLSSPVCGSNLQSSGGGTGMTAPNVHVTCASGSGRLAFFASNDGSYSATLGLENSATAGPSNRAGSGSTGVGLFSSNFVMSSSGNGGSQSGSLSGGAVSIGATVIINAGSASTIDHIQLEISGTPLTCTPSTVTVKACTNAACSTLSGSSATVTLGATSGTLGSTSLTFTGSTTTTLTKTSVGNTTLSATSSPAATNSAVCLLNGSTAASCQYTFADSGLLLTIPGQTAGVTSSGGTRFSLAAVRKSDNGLNCTPAFASVTRNVKFWTGYTSPASGTKTLAVQGTTVATASPGTTVSLSFDSTGTASNLTLNYADAGQLTLYAQYDGSAGTGDSGLTMTGNTAFVTVPYALCVDSPDTNWGCTAADTTCTKFTSAGTAFNLRVTGKAYQAATATCSLPTTPNYIQSNLTLTSALVAPSGGVNATLSPTTISISSGGTATQATQTVSEVGVFTITATPSTNGYFSSYTVPAGTSSNSGRFVPDGFTVTSNTINDRSGINTTTTIGGAETCSSSFTYLGESLRSLFVLTAVNASGNTTQNYRGTFARLNMAPVASAGTNGLAFGAQSGATLLNSRLTASCASCGAFSAGVANVAADLTVNRSTGSTVNGPYSGASFGVVATDPDSVTMRSPNWSYDLVGGNDGLSLGTTNLYFGRFRIDNAYGSSLQGLSVSAYAQYWSGSTFAKNTADSCSRVTVPTTVSMSSTTTATLYCGGGVGLYGSLTGVSATSGAVSAGGTATMSSGNLALALSKPTNSGGGYLDLALSVPDYLKYNVDNVDQTLPACNAVADSYLHDDNPRARIRFGARTSDKVIYLREVY
ncbi:MAG: hypothetical protein QM776_03825 [Rhodocyclaceae bacterium]